METTEIHELAKELPSNKRDEFMAKLKCIRRFLAEEKSLIWYTVEWMRHNTERGTLSTQRMNIPQYMLSCAKHSVELGFSISLHSLFYSSITITFEALTRFNDLQGSLNRLYRYNYENALRVNNKNKKKKRKRNVAAHNEKR